MSRFWPKFLNHEFVRAVLAGVFVAAGYWVVAIFLFLVVSNAAGGVSATAFLSSMVTPVGAIIYSALVYVAWKRFPRKGLKQDERKNE